MITRPLAPSPLRDTVLYIELSDAQSILRDLLASALLSVEDWEHLPAGVRQELLACSDPRHFLLELVAHGLLTPFQGNRISAGQAASLLLGNYRVRDILGTGGMGVVYLAEHRDLGRPVAVKVLRQSHSQHPNLQRRFLAEMRAVALLQHPNIVAAMDAGCCPDPDPDAPPLRYFVMEHVPGQDLEERVREKGPLSPAEVCDIGYQLANALAEADKHGLVHRDIKPSNVRLTPEGQAKLLDFGLARQGEWRLTEPGTILGSIDYMAPEQASDAGSVDIRADLYSLGATLFWCLTGRSPFEPQDTLFQKVTQRLTQTAPSVRSVRPDVPAELDAVLARLMAQDPAFRYPSPQAVTRALLPFLKPELRDQAQMPGISAPGDATAAAHAGTPGRRVHRVLIVDDDALIRTFCRVALQSEEMHCDEVCNGADALAAVSVQGYDLVIMDIDMPGLTGPEVCQQLRRQPPCPHLKIVMFSGRASNDEMAGIMLAGADDYLAKPFSVVQLLARVQAALQLKDAQDRSDLLNAHLLSVNAELERNLGARESDLIQARNALVLALAELVGYRNAETGAHLVRFQRYCRCLGEEIAGGAGFAGQVDRNFVDMLECCAPLHDIGNAGLPDHILMKPGTLTPDERAQMETHTVIGGDTLEKVARKHGFARGFLQMAIEIARHHHERYDGRGYPDGLAGDAIPLAARVVAVVDAYDSLRARRIYKPALSHTTAVRMMTEEFTGHFDPALVEAFARCAPEFERIFRECVD